MMNEMMTGAYIRTINDNEEMYDFNFYTNLSAANKLKFVNSVVNVLVDENYYNSIIRDLVFDFFVIDIMTDIDTSELKKSSSFVNDVEQFLEETNIVDVVRANVSPFVFDELNKAIDNSIQYLTGIHPNPLNEALANLVNTLEKKVDGIDLNSMMQMAQKFIGITDEFTPKNIVDAYIDSEIHKNNLVEVANSKKKTKKTK